MNRRDIIVKCTDEEYEIIIQAMSIAASISYQHGSDHTLCETARDESTKFALNLKDVRDRFGYTWVRDDG